MGRRKIEILPIQHDRNRSVTFLKRKNGLFKKAYELGVLCSVDVAVIIFGHNNKVYEYCSTDSDAMVQRRLHYTGERDVKTPADFGGDKAGNDDDEDGSDDAGPSRNGKFPGSGKKRGRDDDHGLEYDAPGHLLHMQQQQPRQQPPSLPSLARPVPPVSLPIPPYHPHPSLPQPHQQSADAFMEREKEREREREGALRQLGLQHLLTSSNPSGQFAPHNSHPSLMSNLNIAALLQANPLLGLGVGGLNLGINGLMGAGGNTGGGQQDLLAMLSANAANVGQPNALYSNPLFSTLFPNHPNLGDSNPAPPAADPPQKPSSGFGSGGDIWPSLARTEPTPSAPVSNNGDTSWLSFLGGSRASQPPTDEVDLSSLFPFEVTAGADDEDDDRGGKRMKRS